MPPTQVCFYCDADGTAPVLDWLEELARTDRRAYRKCREVINRLGLMGTELRRPTSDLLADGVHELRARVGRVNYRVLYFFHPPDTAVLLHGLTKEKAIPTTALRRATERKARFQADPHTHTHRE